MLFLKNKCMKKMGGVTVRVLQTLVWVVLLAQLQTACSKQTSGSAVDTYTLKIGQHVDITLNANPSTGYSWSWINKATVTTVDSVAAISVSTNNVPGSPSQEIWRFKAVKAGSDSIKFRYAQPWVGGAVGETRTLFIKVN
jgi:inhibitor of cysteine peptidase